MMPLFGTGATADPATGKNYRVRLRLLNVGKIMEVPGIPASIAEPDPDLDTDRVTHHAIRDPRLANHPSAPILARMEDHHGRA
jgi:hypothetical protein